MSYARPGRETIMTALFNTLVAAVQTSFTANTTQGSTTLGAPSTTTGLFIGLPVFGVGIPRGAVITQLTPTLTIDQPATANGTAVALVTGFMTFSRRFKLWSDVSEQPALFLRDGTEELTYPASQLQEQIIRVEVWIYSKAGANPDIAPIVGLNNLLDAVQAALTPDNPGMFMFTLGGLVFWCRMAGKVEKDPGDLDGQAVAIIDIEIIVP